MSKKSRPQSLTRGKKSRIASGSKLQDKLSNIKDAIELSISASEALTISEISKDDSVSLPTTSVVEIALRVKQARNQFCSDGVDSISDCVTMEIDEADSLSDLDEDIMAGAFEDVGFCNTQLDTICCSSSVKKSGCSSSEKLPLVLKTPLSKRRCGYAGETCVEIRSQKVDIDRGPNLLKDSFGCLQQKEKLLHCEPSMVFESRFHPPVPNMSNLSGEVEVVEPFVFPNLKTTKIVPNFFHGETSFLSESADVDKDEIPVAAKLGLESQIVSLASVAFNGICGTTNEIVASQDMCSSASLDYLLCSIVPCSISPDNTNVPTTNLKCVEEEATKELNRQLQLDNSHSRRLSFDISDGGGDAEFKRNGGGSGAIIRRRKLSSLKSYSMFLPSQDAVTERSDSHNVCMPKGDIRNLLSSEKVIECVKSSGLKESTELLPSMAKNCDAAKYYDKVHEIPATQNPILASLDQQKGVDCVAHEDQGPLRKRVRFSEAEGKFQQSNGQKKLSREHMRSISGTGKRSKRSSLQSDLRCHEANTCPTTRQIKRKNKMILQGLEFLLTGFTSEKEADLGAMIRKHGGFVLYHVPSPLRGTRRSRCTQQQLPLLLSPRKLQTTKFLYGCAVGALLLKVNWLTDSIAACSLLPPRKYMIISNQDGNKCSKIRWPICWSKKTRIFDKVGIMLHGKPIFCTKLANVIKHGGGQVFKTLHSMVQGLKNGKFSLCAIVVEDDGRASRHLRHCASEQNVHVMPESWIISSLHLGYLLPFRPKQLSAPSPRIKIPEVYIATQLSQEI